MRKRRRWLGRAGKVKSSRVTPMAGNRPVRKLVIHNEGADRDGQGDPRWLAEYVRSRGIEYHMIWNARTGKFVQLLPFDSAARSLMNGGIDGGIGTNRSGQVCIQVCVQGYGNKPFTDGPMKGAEVLGKIADSWDVPHRVRKKWGSGAGRSSATWAKSGVHGHCHSPGNDHHDPARIDPRKLERALWPRNRRRR